MRHAILTLMALAATLSAAPRRGVVQEVWTGISGEQVSDLTGNAKYQKAPDEARILASFQCESVADGYGQRLSALVSPPATGNYTFWIASDDGGELWLSADADAANLQRVATVKGWSDPLQWTKQPNQQSKPVRLEKGKFYLVRAFSKDGAGADHLAVAWQGPGMERQVLGGEHVTAPLDSRLAAIIRSAEKRDRERKVLEKQIIALMEKGTTLPADLAARMPNTCAAPPTNDTGINVLVDQAHQTSFVILWGLRGQIRTQGFRACSNLATLDSVLKPGGQSRIRLRVGKLEPFAWIPNPEFNVIITAQTDEKAQHYTESERKALKAFVEAGGGLLLMAKRPRDKATADRWSMNALAGDYGARFTHEGKAYSALALDEAWDVLLKGKDDAPIRARRSVGKGRVMICETAHAVLSGKKDDAAAKAKKVALLKDSITWLAAGKEPVGGEGRLPDAGGAGIFPEKELNLGGLVVYYADNQPPATMKCIRDDIPKAAKQIRAWLPSKTFGEPYNLVICAGGGGGWAINPRPKAAAVISYSPLGILGIFAHEMAHTMGGPRNDKDELAGRSPHHNQGESHAGWFQGKIGAMFSGKTDESNRNCNSILALEKRKGRKLDVAKYDREFWGKGPDWTKHWYIFQKMDDRYGPTWYPRWYWVRGMRWRDDPAHAETWDELVESMSIAAGEDLFPFFKKIGTTLSKGRLERIVFQGKTLEFPVAPIDDGPGGNVDLGPIGDYKQPIQPKGK